MAFLKYQRSSKFTATLFPNDGSRFLLDDCHPRRGLYKSKFLLRRKKKVGSLSDGRELFSQWQDIGVKSKLGSEELIDRG